MSARKHAGRRLRVAIVGAGKVGLVLGKLLARHGEQIVSVVSRTAASAAKGARFLRCPVHATDLAAIPPDVSLVMITTPHGAVEQVARELAALETLNFRRLSVCHASGMLTSRALAPLAERGATVFSFHPLQTFPRDFEPRDIVPTARGIFYGVDGNRAALRRAKDLARRLQGTVIEISPEMRELYHAACVVASNHLTTMLSVLERMYGTIMGGQREFFPVFKPILEATLRNIERTSPAQALSGPIARGGIETVAGHIQALRKHAPDLLPYFSAVSQETVRLAVAKGSIDRARAAELSRLLVELSDGYQPTAEQT